MTCRIIATILGFFFGGPLKLGELPPVAFAVAGRRSYIDALIPIALDVFVGPQGQAITAAPVYQDYQAKAQTQLGREHQLSVIAFGSVDDLKVSARGTGDDEGFDLGLRSQGHRAVGTWAWQPWAKLRNRFSPHIGFNRADMSIGQRGDNGLSIGTVLNTWVWGVRDTLAWEPRADLSIDVGADYRGGQGTFSLDAPVQNAFEVGGFPRIESRPFDEQGKLQIDNTLQAHNAAVFATVSWTPFLGLSVIPGLRGENFRHIALPITLPDGTTTDENTREKTAVEPRLTFRWQIGNASVVKGAWGMYHQQVVGYLSSQSGGNPNLDLERAEHRIAGLEHRLTRTLNIDLQFYALSYCG